MTTRIEPRLTPTPQRSDTPEARQPNAAVAPEAAKPGKPHDSFEKKSHANDGGHAPPMNKVERAIQQRMEQLARGEVEGTTGGTIDVHFHVINKGKGVKNGDVTQTMIDKQISVLNDAYKSTGWQFRLASVDRTTNKDWYTALPRSAAEIEMKSALRKGTSEDLNIYSTSPGEGLLGWATFPSDYAKDPVRDGVVLLNASLPGGSGEPYNEGDTATHEVGHWMGLYHTWNQPKGQSKVATGDYVEDTPAHAEPNFGTPPETTDTLPEEPGFDPVHNYMNYVDDAHMWEFTPGQDLRMDAQWQLFREVRDEGEAKVA